jgi:RNA 2',3'-cyclic 3'-phosphodiesterase
VAARVWNGLERVRARHTDVRWLTPERLHLTLVFLGSTDAERVPVLADAIRDVAAAHSSFGVATGDAGGRVGGRRGGVAWLRLAHGGRDLAQLARAVDDALGSHTYDERNAPRPHLTLARGATEAALADLRASAPRLRSIWTVDRIVLFRSYTDPKGSRYEELTSHDLTATRRPRSP